MAWAALPHGLAAGGHKHASHSVSGIAASRSKHPWDGKCFPDHVVGGGSGTLGSRCDLAAWFSGEPLRLRRLAAVNGFLILIWCFTPWSTPGVTVASAGVFDITKEGLLLSLLVTMKCNAVFLLFDAFVPGMRLTEMASGLRAARLPMKLVTLLLFMTRETGLLSRSYSSLSESVQLRGFRASLNKHSYQTLAAFISTLFIRAYARSRVLNEALILRGFSGHWPVPASGLKNAGEAGLLVLTISLALLLLVWDFVS